MCAARLGAAATAAGAAALSFTNFHRRTFARQQAGSPTGKDTDKEGECEYHEGVFEAIGNTPLLELKSLSRLTQCTILAKAEHLNPGGSVKDRAAKWMILNAERTGELVPGEPCVVVEGTGGNTGIALAMLAASRGYRSVNCLHENISKDKIRTMEALGAQVTVCPSVPFSDQRHYYHTANRIATGFREQGIHALWTNQFENVANGQAHFESTGPEIWKQAGGKVDGLVLSAGTGGTISGVSRFLKLVNPNVQVYLIDCPSSGLASYVRTGHFQPGTPSVAFEGIGIDRLTANFESAKIDGAFDGTDREGVEMLYYLARNEGLLVGPSAALNCVGAVKLARKLGPGHVIVTVLCDNGHQYREKVYSAAWLREKQLEPQQRSSDDLSFVQ